MPLLRLIVVLVLLSAASRSASAQQIAGELKQWHDVVLTFDGPASSESANPKRLLGNPPKEPAKDWEVLIRRTSAATPAVSGQTLDGPAPFLVKLGVDLGSATSRVGDAVTAVVISPERFLGASFEGTVDQVSSGAGRFLRFTFHRLIHKENTYRVTSAITGFVNSLGHRSVDEGGRPVEVGDGVLTATSADFRLNEGAEFQLQVTSAALTQPASCQAAPSRPTLAHWTREGNPTKITAGGLTP